MRQLRTDSLRWMVGLFCGLLGMIMLVNPYQFIFMKAAAFPAYLSIFGICMLLTGIGMLLSIIMQMEQKVTRWIRIITAFFLCVIAVALFISGGRLSGVNFFLLGLGTAVTLLFDTRRPMSALESGVQVKPPEGDLLALVLGGSAVLTGLVMMLGRVSTAIFHLEGMPSPLLGSGFVLLGCVLVALQLVPQARFQPVLRNRQAVVYGLLAAMFFIFLGLATRPESLWLGIAYYGWFGLGLLAMPRFFHPERQFDPTKLHIRLALAFSLACTLPLILTVALINWMTDPTASPLYINGVPLFPHHDIVLGVLLIFLLITTYGGMRIARWLILPIERLSAAAQILAEGGADVPLTPSGVTEVQQLAEAFQYLRERLAERTAESERSRQELEEGKQMLEMRVAAHTAELRLNNQRMEALLSALPVGVMISDAKGRIIEKNGMADKIWGGDAPLSKSVEEYAAYQGWWPDTGESVNPRSWALARAVCDGEICWGEVVDILRFDGSPATVLNSAAPIRDETGALKGGVQVVQDISHQREIERLARESARTARKTSVELEAIFNSLTDGVFLYDSDGIVQQANSRAVAMFGFDPVRMSMEQVTRKLELLDETGRRITRETLPSFRALSGQSNVNMRASFKNTRGREYVTLVSASPVYVGKDLVGVVSVWHDVTERERLMLQNRIQRELFERLIREAPTGIAFIQGPDFQYTLVNPAYEQIARGKGSPVGRTASEVWPELADSLLPLFQQVYKTGQPVRQADQLFHVKRDGQTEEDYFTISLTPLVDGDGQVEGILVLTLETTDEVRAHAEAEEERARLQAIIEHAPEGIVVMDCDGKVMLLNPAAERISGRPGREDNFSTKNGNFVFLPDGTPFPVDAFPMVQAVQTGSVYHNVEMLLRHPDGRFLPVLVNAAPVRDLSGEITGAVGIFQDMTEILHAEQALRESEGRFRGLVESMNEIVFTLDAEQVFTGIYGLGLERFGISAEQVVGKTLDEVIGSTAPVHTEGFYSVMAGKSVVYEWSDQTQQGLTYFQNSLAPLHDEQGRVNGVVGIARDVTLSKLAEHSLEKYAEQLQRSNQELEQFAFIASHDLQEPLRKIQAFGQRVQQRMAGRIEEEEQDYLSRMVNASERMQNMIQALLTFSRVTTKGQPFAAVDMNAVAESVLEDLEVRIERSGARVEIRGLPEVEADAMQMQQLLQNLIGNALKYHRPGVPPEVRVVGEILTGDDLVDMHGGAEVHSGINAAKEQVRIQVSDNGIGFDEQYIERIFQPFERLVGRSEYEGTGMGLAICRKIVERHHGTLSARSQPGEGSTFEVILPRKQPGNRR